MGSVDPTGGVPIHPSTTHAIMLQRHLFEFIRCLYSGGGLPIHPSTTHAIADHASEASLRIHPLFVQRWGSAHPPIHHPRNCRSCFRDISSNSSAVCTAVGV